MRFLVSIAILISLYAPTKAFAHGGGLNAQGCHNQRSNGTYHCHRSQIRRPTPVRAVSSAPNRIYANCDAVYAAGVAPISRKERGYGSHLDRDGDGIACENPPAGYINHGRGRLPVVIAPLPVSVTESKLAIPIEGVAQVLDGDTLQIGIKRIRLYGIDAFESEQSCNGANGEAYGCGGIATRALSEYIETQSVTCVPKGRDVYDRQLAVCRLTSVDLSSYMARNGHALAYTKYAYDYVSDEAVAKENTIGAWSGSFDMPWDYRQTRSPSSAEAQRTATAPSANCNIKGNVRKDGTRIYHMPSDASYQKVKPENWFCDEDEAKRAGFRRAGVSK
jgi:endonuclease YncB( thermonuclease family)